MFYTDQESATDQQGLDSGTKQETKSKSVGEAVLEQAKSETIPFSNFFSKPSTSNFETLRCMSPVQEPCGVTMGLNLAAAPPYSLLKSFLND